MQPEQYSPHPTLTPQQHHLLSLLAQGVSITAASAAVGIHRNTAANWRRTVPAFARELDCALREHSLFWHDHAAGLAQKAVEIISTILHNDSAAPSLRLHAAMKILAIASSPQPALLKPSSTSASGPEAVDSRAESEKLHNSAQSAPPQTAQPAQNCTIPPIRGPREPARNSLCPCKSSLKSECCCSP